MKCSRFNALKPESQLSFLYETRTLRSSIHRARRHYNKVLRPQGRSIHTQSDQDDTNLGDADESLTSSPQPASTRAIHDLLSEVLARSEKLRHQRPSYHDSSRSTSFLRRKAESVARQPQIQDEDTAEKELPRTITRAEKAVFKHIFENLAKGQAVSTPLSEHRGDTETSTGSSFDLEAFVRNTDVTAILQELYGSSARPRDDFVSGEVSPDEVAKYPKALRRMALKARAAVVARISSGSGSFVETSRDASLHGSDPKAMDVQNICMEALRSLSQAINGLLKTRQNSEHPLLELYEKHIFGLMPGVGSLRLLNSPPDVIPGEVAKATQARKKGRRKKTKEEEKVSTMMNQVAPGDDGSMFNVSRNLHLPGGDFTIPEHIPPLEVLSTLGPAAIVLAARYLTSNFPNSSLLLSFLPTLHSMGPEAYVLGSSTTLYNTLLAHRWIHYSDLKAMEDILIDMEAGAVSFDINTIHILDAIREERFYSLSRGHLGYAGIDDKTLRPAWWWQMGSTPTDFQRVTEEWRQIIANSLEDTGMIDDVPDITYGDDMLDSLRQQPSENAVML